MQSQSDWPQLSERYQTEIDRDFTEEEIINA